MMLPLMEDVLPETCPTKSWLPLRSASRHAIVNVDRAD